jgi:tyrosinase
MKVNLGPVAPTLAEPEVTVPAFLSYNPRCLKRDVSSWVSSNWTRDVDVANLITKHATIADFQDYMQGQS